MKRTPLKRKTPLRAKRRPVVGWRRPPEDKVTDEVIAIVDRRDGPCIAVKIDPRNAADCWGRTTYDHVHPHAGGTKAKRARSIPAELAAVCQGHSEDGMKAGHQWNTSHRDEMRDWIRRHTP